MIDKTKECLEEIKLLFPGKIKLNATQTCKCVGISSTTFNNIIKTNEEKYKLPKFKSNEIPREGKPCNSYQFSIYDIADFLAK